MMAHKKPKRDMSSKAVLKRMTDRWKFIKNRHFSHKKNSTKGRGRRK